MTNYEKYKDWFGENYLAFLYGRAVFGVDIETNKPVFCDELECEKCKFNGECMCENSRVKWLYKQEEPEHPLSKIMRERDNTPTSSYEEARNRLKRLLSENPGAIPAEYMRDMEFAVSALERRTPKRPLSYSEYYKKCILCPHCGCKVVDETGFGLPACMYCGQDIDWRDAPEKSDEEE